MNLICNFFHPKFDFQPQLVQPICRAVNLAEWGKSAKVAPNEVKFASTVKPLYNVPPYNVFLPIAFKMFGPGKVP